jgi:hypothetical protein
MGISRAGDNNDVLVPCLRNERAGDPRTCRSIVRDLDRSGAN